jgi:hypothetical protein
VAIIPETIPIPSPCRGDGRHNKIAVAYITIFQLRDMPPKLGEIIRSITPIARSSVVIVIQRKSLLLPIAFLII